MALTNDPDLDIIVAALQKEMSDKLATHDQPLDIVLFGEKKDKHEGKWKTYREKQS